MSKIHVNSNGEPGVCKATKVECPFGSEETHFKSEEEASSAYEKAQSAMGNGLGGSKTALEGAVSKAESLEDAQKIANIVANEGKYAVVTRFSTVSIAHQAPVVRDGSSYYDGHSDEDYGNENTEYSEDDTGSPLRSDDDYDTGEPEVNEFKEWKDDIASSSWDEIEGYNGSEELVEETYYVRAFENEKEINEFRDATLTRGSSLKWGGADDWNHIDSGDINSWGKDHQSLIDFDDEEFTVSSLHQELYKPKK